MDLSLDLLRDTYNYNHWIYSLIRPYLGDTLIEVGSGQGNITRFLLCHKEVVCLEPNKEYKRRLDSLAAVHLNLRVIEAGDEALDGKWALDNHFDTVVCLNVLEHIEDDLQAMKRFRGILGNGGRILLYVPACPWAFGEIDRNLGHYRRYSKRGLVEMAGTAGFSVIKCHAVNFLGAFGWWWASRVKRETHIDRKKAAMVDRVVPIISAVEKIARPLIGQSILLVAEKK